jgi:hypothetical protein
LKIKNILVLTTGLAVFLMPQININKKFFLHFIELDTFLWENITVIETLEIEL